MQKKILGVLVLLLVSSGFSFGQRLTGGISLRVTDPQGNAVPNVKASVLSKEHGTKVEVAGTNEGEVTVADLAPGEYEVVIQHEGFRKTTVTLTVRIGVNTSLDIHLEVGAVSESIIVEANTVTVDTSKSTVQGVIEAAQIDQLPLNGRNFLDLAQMAPGVQVVDGGSFDPTKNQFAGVSVGGRSGRSTRIQVDGVDITDETVGTAQRKQRHTRVGLWVLAAFGLCGQQWTTGCAESCEAGVQPRQLWRPAGRAVPQEQTVLVFVIREAEAGGSNYCQRASFSGIYRILFGPRG